MASDWQNDFYYFCEFVKSLNVLIVPLRFFPIKDWLSKKAAGAY